MLYTAGLIQGNGAKGTIIYYKVKCHNEQNDMKLQSGHLCLKEQVLQGSVKVSLP